MKKITKAFFLIYLFLISWDLVGQVENLKLTSMCSEYPEEIRRWRIRNPNATPIIVWWEVIGTNQKDTTHAPVGDSFFYTDAVSGPNTTKLNWFKEDGSIKSTVKASGGADCRSQVVIGANYNKSSEGIEIELVEEVGADWVRSFIDVSLWLKNQRTEAKKILLRRYDGFDTLRSISENPYNKKLILGFRWSFINNKKPVPAPGSLEESAMFDVFQVVLEEIGDRITYLVLGNEPFLETPNSSQVAAEGELAPVVVFNKRLLDLVVEPFYANKSTRPEFFVGAFNALHDPAMNTKAGVRQLIEFAADDHRISGIDMHPHAQTMEEVEQQLIFARDSMGFYKKIIATEYSLVGMFGKNKADLLGSTLEGQAFVQLYGAANGFTESTKVRDFYEYVNNNDVPNESQMFLDMFLSRSWYVEDFMGKFLEFFERYKVHESTYGLNQNEVETGLATAWWAVKVFMPATLGYDTSGIPIRNPLIDPIYFSNETSTPTARISAAPEQSVVNPDHSKGLEVYPNPASDFVMIVSDAELPTSVDFINMYGQVVRRLENIHEHTEINVSDLKPGTYIVNIQNGGQHTKRLVVISQ